MDRVGFPGALVPTSASLRCRTGGRDVTTLSEGGEGWSRVGGNPDCGLEKGVSLLGSTGEAAVWALAAAPDRGLEAHGSRGKPAAGSSHDAVTGGREGHRGQRATTTVREQVASLCVYAGNPPQQLGSRRRYVTHREIELGARPAYANHLGGQRERPLDANDPSPRAAEMFLAVARPCDRSS